ncbi:subtilase-type protease inhibitor [Streptomyces roseicoloratus]|uniref:Probable subtilase-type protease inhibitor n=1 Tax=Streptomyces roseicoloratus TaxID=2508722 RepID=A0ABY9RTZ2_9ACTN|nr:subtilase-type protease inhibitor [Streptomyces roseicoloratus]WMX45669.1 subtilase-type protease inhibitor [Streptomyces roseicoloratus]
MRYFRALGATAFATATGLALVGTAFTGTGTAEAASASSTSLYAPSALVLTLGQGSRPSTATVVRAVTLSCSPTPAGTHPAPEEACAELNAAGGDFGQVMAISGDRPCTREWNPVTVTGDGVWQGRRVHWSATYGNDCELRSRTAEGAVFAF